MSRVTRFTEPPNRRRVGSDRYFYKFFAYRSRFPESFYYLCRRYFEGVPYYQAEIIPIEPHTANAETGMHNLSTHTPFQFINF